MNTYMICFEHDVQAENLDEAVAKAQKLAEVIITKTEIKVAVAMVNDETGLEFFEPQVV